MREEGAKKKFPRTPMPRLNYFLPTFPRRERESERLEVLFPPKNKTKDQTLVRKCIH